MQYYKYSMMSHAGDKKQWSEVRSQETEVVGWALRATGIVRPDGTQG
jgi:hypothetical protein